jgi:eukaryotic-like serine/threonine-protein kinase
LGPKLYAMVGETFGNYRIARRLGSGAMGTVFLGEHERIARSAAIKFLAPEFATNAEILGRFFDEARATSVIHHPAIVEILDCGLHLDGQPYITMEYLAGETLADLLERAGAIPWPEACGMAAQIADGLAAAHRHRIVHRDVKPANIMCLADPEGPTAAAPVSVIIKVLDFGVAKLLQDTQSGARTHPGKLLGTPEYMAPEQCGGEGTVDARTDIYALGCVLYEMVSGNPPFPADNLSDLIVAHRWREPPDAGSAADVPRALDRLIARMLAKRQGDRPATMESVARALRDVLARPDDVAGEAAPTMTKVAATRPGRPELSRAALGKRRLARGRSLTIVLATAGLAAATSLVVHVAHRRPKREAVVAAAPRVVIRPPVSATPPASTREPSPPRAVTSAPTAAAPVLRRHARESTHGRASHPANVDTDGIVDL